MEAESEFEIVEASSLEPGVLAMTCGEALDSPGGIYILRMSEMKSVERVLSRENKVFVMYLDCTDVTVVDSTFKFFVQRLS